MAGDLAIATGFLWAALVAALIFRAWRQFGAYRRLELTETTGPDILPRLAVVVPARNEARTIGGCIAGLAAQGYPRERLRLIVVDDGSTDGTAALARRAVTPFDLRLIEAGPLPPGWTGKCHACWRGAAAAEAAEFLCFLDADVTPGPALMRAAAVAAQRGRLDLLSLEPRHELGSPAERLVIPAGLFALAFLRDLRRPNDPASSEATANGQFILVRRAAYDRVGGHRAVRAAICEDKRLAQAMKDAGYAVALLAAPSMARVRMYRGLADLWTGLRKNSTETLGGVGPALAAAILAAPLGWAALVVPLVLAARVAVGPATPVLLVALALATLASVAIACLHVEGARYLEVPRWYGLLFPVGYTLAALIAADGLRQHWRGATEWKGRHYATRPGARGAGFG